MITLSDRETNPRKMDKQQATKTNKPKMGRARIMPFQALESKPKSDGQHEPNPTDAMSKSLLRSRRDMTSSSSSLLFVSVRNDLNCKVVINSQDIGLFLQ
jgi:hypothetical protein